MVGPNVQAKPTNNDGAKSPVSIAGIVKSVSFSGNGWSAGRITPDGATDSSAFAGACTVKPGDSVRLVGAWKNDPKWGRQFSVEYFEYIQPVSVSGLCELMARNPDMKGIGPVRARKLAERFAATWEHSLANDPEEMARVAGVPLAIIVALRDSWNSTKQTNQAATWLHGFGLTHLQVQKVIAVYGNSCMSVLQENPYRLMDHVPGMGFRRCDDVALKLGVEKTLPARVEACILYTLRELGEFKGHTCFELGELRTKTIEALILQAESEAVCFDKGLVALGARAEVVVQKVGITTVVGLARLHDAEREIVEKLSALSMEMEA